MSGAPNSAPAIGRMSTDAGGRRWKMRKRKARVFRAFLDFHGRQWSYSWWSRGGSNIGRKYAESLVFPEDPTGKCPRRCPQHRQKGTGPQSGPLGGRRRTTTPPLSIYRATVKPASSPPYQATPATMPTAPSESPQAPTCTGPRIRRSTGGDPADHPHHAVDRHRGALHDARMGNSLPGRRVPADRDPRPGGGASARHRRGTSVPSVPRPTPRPPSGPPSNGMEPRDARALLLRILADLA